MDDIDATDPRGRAKIALADSRTAATRAPTRCELLTAVARIVEEAWNDNPATTWEKAKRLLAAGHDRHDVIHTLAG